MRSKSQRTGFFARKALHIAMVGGVAVVFLTQGRWMAFTVSLVAFALLLLGEWLRTSSPALESLLLATLGPLMTADERRRSRHVRFNGATWAMLAATIALLIFPGHVGLAAVIILALGDPAAAVVGSTYGRMRIGARTLEGTCAFFFASLLSVLLLTGLSPVAAIVGAAAGAVAELLPIPGSDNLRVTLFAGAAIALVVWL